MTEYNVKFGDFSRTVDAENEEEARAAALEQLNDEVFDADVEAKDSVFNVTIKFGGVTADVAATSYGEAEDIVAEEYRKTIELGKEELPHGHPARDLLNDIGVMVTEVEEQVNSNPEYATVTRERVEHMDSW